MVFKLVLCIILVGTAAGLCLRSGLDWQRDRGRSWGESCMREYGLGEEKNEIDMKDK